MLTVGQGWLDGTGPGLFVLCPEVAAGGWTGCDEGLLEAAADYAAACPVPGHGDVLVLGGEPLLVGWLAEERVFVRPLHVDCAHDVRPLVREALRSGVWEDGPFLDLIAGRYLLTDVFDDGGAVLERGGYLTVELPPGRYLVQSLKAESDRRAQFHLERLLPR
ncbi:Imm21 family immunity protein [Kitasatospora sp. NPDC057940]|uniref:Imm21 family immunity protein n=1 Tax=Kitasatospora sp. NPDC057940 TaxID=3346285 RepID=UPI0036D8B259